VKIWLIIAAIGGAWLLFRRRDAQAKTADANSVEVPVGTQIGQIGARIESPEALRDFARSLAISAEPRVIEVVQPAGVRNGAIYWSDGRTSLIDSITGELIRDTPFIPSP
jgi:hypothetical protein